MKNIDLLYEWCFGCDNYKKSLQGPICKVSEKKPDFVKSCPHYIGNVEYLKKSQQKLIERNHEDDDFFENIKPTLLTKEITDLPVELILRNRKFDFQIIYLLIIDFLGAYLFSYLRNDTLNIFSLEFLQIFGLLSIVSLPIYMIIASKSADQSKKITLSENGIKLENGSLISWENTFTYLITKYANTDRDASWMRNEFLVIKKPFEKEKLFPIDSLEKNPSELGILIENYKNKYVVKYI